MSRVSIHGQPYTGFPSFAAALFAKPEHKLLTKGETTAQRQDLLIRIGNKLLIPPGNMEEVCWLWNGARRGGPVALYKGDTYNPVRLLVMLHYGFPAPPPPGCLRKQCGTKLCIHPGHYSADGLLWTRYLNQMGFPWEQYAGAEMQEAEPVQPEWLGVEHFIANMRLEDMGLNAEEAGRVRATLSAMPNVESNDPSVLKEEWTNRAITAFNLCRKSQPVYIPPPTRMEEEFDDTVGLPTKGKSMFSGMLLKDEDGK